MINIKNERGITLIALILTIIIMLILATVAVETGIGSISESKMLSFVSKMQIIQKKVDVLSENGEYKTLGKDLSQEMIGQLKAIMESENLDNPIRVLPSEYQQLEYIQSTGTQWIDTRVNGYITAELEAQGTEIPTAGQLIIGVQYNSGEGFGTWDKSNRWGCGSAESNVLYTNRAKITIDFVETGTNFIINDIKYAGTSTPNTSTTYALFRNKTGSNYPAKAKLYYCKIWQDNILKRYFVPCKNKSTNVIGLYDLVTSEFYTNSGTGTFTAGPEILNVAENNSVSYKNLPVEYQQVEYIKSTGEQYIDTRYKASYNSRIYVDFAYDEVTLQARVFGSRDPVDSTDYLLFETYINGKGNYAWTCIDGVGDWRNTGKTAGTGRVQIDFDSFNNKIKYTGAVSYEKIITTQRTTRNRNPIYIFASNYDGAKHFGNLKLYYMIIEENGEKVREFIPCVRNSDNKPGLFDIVENKFYINPRTGEDLIAGSTIEEGITQNVEYTNSFRYFDKDTIVSDLEIDNVDEPIIVDFATRQVISLKGIKYEGKMYYSQYNLPGGQKIEQNPSQNIRQMEDVNITTAINGLNATFTISGITYTNGTLSYSRNDKQTWTEITNYTVAGQDVVTENITKSGLYYFKWTDNTNKNNEYILDVVELRLVNSPQLKGDLELVRNTYNYSDYETISSNWAYAEANEKEYVWIPRFAYNEDNKIEFLRGSSYVTTGEDYLPSSGWEIPEPLKNVTGLWIDTSTYDLSNKPGNVLDIVYIVENGTAL